MNNLYDNNKRTIKNYKENNNSIGSFDPEISENLNKNYELFAKNYETAFADLATRNLEDIAKRTESELLGIDKLILSFFEKWVILDLTKKRIYSIVDKEIFKIINNSENKNQTDIINKSNVIKHLKNFDFKNIDSYNSNELEPLDLFSSTIILHYLLTADGTPLSGKWILFRELLDGLFYGDTIPGVLQPLVKKYEYSGQEFLRKILDNGGKIYKDFKFAGVIYPFERFPILFIFEEKDEEFTADLRVLFDSSASHYIKSDIIKTLVVYTVKKLL
jgi:hypothetical protein